MDITIKDVEQKAVELRATTDDFETAKKALVKFTKQDHCWVISWSTQAWSCHDTVNRALKKAGFRDLRDAGTADTIAKILNF